MADSSYAAWLTINSCVLVQLCDGYQGVAGGVLRGMGHQARIAVVNMLAFWAVGIPLGAFMAFKLQMGMCSAVHESSL